MKTPLLKLNNGVEMPALGLGVFQSSPEDTIKAVATAIADGYRLIDTARAYKNESQVGEGIRNSGINRAELFVTTKLWLTDYGYDAALRGFDGSLTKLRLDYLDLYLLHWPTKNFDATVQSYKAAEKLLAAGRVRAIGVCNHTEQQLEALIARTDVVPAVNQVELHPYFAQKALRQTSAALGIVMQAWSPIGGVKRYWPGASATGTGDPLADPVITGIGRAHGKTAAQVILRWQFQNGVVAIPKSVKAARIAKNIDIFDFVLSDSEMTKIDALDTGARGGPDPTQIDMDSFSDTVDRMHPVRVSRRDAKQTEPLNEHRSIRHSCSYHGCRLRNGVGISRGILGSRRVRRAVRKPQ
ncbi:MAG TPA: aldo/keto reductase [Nitrospira sp.]|nr:aldo/keto reductase [Nitrospira sp.]HMU29147.1 aldo/keto reductase [Nitrospira sp.]HMV55652.1 aldo/keto reductase [Nitrospira sp.]HMW85197.1 aldo/keto reductase [Nitrospira sp.]HMX90541.1 aldo/keto reductase [Nitrospira sp.]